jgi:hypothetical protein
MMRKTGLFIPVWMADLFSDGLKQGKLERRPLMNRGENTSSQLSGKKHRGETPHLDIELKCEEKQYFFIHFPVYRTSFIDPFL